MSEIKIGCQGYTWEMNWDRWRSVLKVFDDVAAAGYDGVEVSSWMLKGFFGRPDVLKKELADRSLDMSVTTLVGGYAEPAEAEQTVREADRLMEFMQEAGIKQCMLGGGNVEEGAGDRDANFRAMCETYNLLGRMAKERGLIFGVHPHSHDGSIINSPEDYARVMELTDPDCFYFGPDTGHMVRSGCDPCKIIRDHFDRITHIHFKDADESGRYVLLGQGVCDYPAILELLDELGYDGWVMAEEESAFGAQSPLEAVRKNREYLKSLGY